MVNGLWKDIFSTLEEKKEVNEGDKDILLTLSAQIVFYVVNFNTIPMEFFIKQLGLTWYEVWEKIDAVLRYDVRMPTNIKIHLLGL